MEVSSRGSAAVGREGEGKARGGGGGLALRSAWANA